MEPPADVSELAWQTVSLLVERWQRRPEAFGGVEQAAAEAGYEHTHFAKLFRSVVGEAPAAYVRGLRLERAALRLEDPEATVAQVALEAGYGSPEAFTRAFRRRFGSPPQSFRAQPPVPAPAERPGALAWGDRSMVARSFRGWGLPCGSAPDAMAAAMEAVRLDDAPPETLGALSQPWGWSHVRGQPSFVALQLTDRRPVPAPLWPVWVPERTWLGIDWAGAPWEVGGAIVWAHTHGLPQVGLRGGFAPTLTFFRADGGLRVWIPVRGG